MQTRFPPEPNGYLHIGHAKSICLNFGIAAGVRRASATCGWTTPIPARKRWSTSIRSWKTSAGWASTGRTGCIYASDYFDQLYQWAEQLMLAGKAYVCDLTADEVRQHRGTLTEPGKDSPYRNRPSEENLDLFRRMRAGEFPDGSRTLRAKIDMASPNLNLRDPVMYRILHATHHRTGDKLVHLPHLRLRPRRVGLDRGDHALDLHAGVREPPPAVRLVRRAVGHLSIPSRSSSPG